MDPEAAVEDFKKRRENYSKVYEPVDEIDGPHVKIINSRKFIVCNIRGYLPLKVNKRTCHCHCTVIIFQVFLVTYFDDTYYSSGGPLCHEFAYPT
jgi:6-phosphofructo-2-kinase